MESRSSISELSKRARTPKPRYSPEPRRHTPKFSNLRIDTSHRTSDLNADGSEPTSSGPQSTHAPVSENRESRRKSVRIQNDVRTRASTVVSSYRLRKKRTPSPVGSQRENRAADSDECAEWEKLPIVRDDTSFVMASKISISELSKRARTPKPQYSPEPQRPTPRFSNLKIDTSHRTSDLNADGTGPSSSGPQSTHAPVSENRESRRKSVRIQNDVRTRASTVVSSYRLRKKRTPSPLRSQGENRAEDSGECAEWKKLPIVLDDKSFVTDAPVSENRESRRKSVPIRNDVRTRASTVVSSYRLRKKRTPSPVGSQRENRAEDSGECAEWKKLPIVLDDKSFVTDAPVSENRESRRKSVRIQNDVRTRASTVVSSYRLRKKRTPSPVGSQRENRAADLDECAEWKRNSISELSKRARTPKPQYSPEPPRRHMPRFCNLKNDTSHRTSDLNADGSGPSSSGPQPTYAPLSEKRESRRKPFRIQNDVRTRATTVMPSSRPRKKRTPSPPNSHGENTAADADEFADWENLPIVRDDPSFVLTEEHKSRFENITKRVDKRVMMSPSQVANIIRNAGVENARLPRKIQMGGYLMKTWFGLPFPVEYTNVECLLICEFCMFYGRSDPVMQNHAKKCTMRAPPGTEIYRKDNISVFEVDGKEERNYCHHVCLIASLFLESKTTFYDTEPFLFYIVTLNDKIGCHFAGYFSKEKYEPDLNNLSCIMTLPCYQSKGFGRFLIDVSYALSRREKWLGGPEKPLSDLGQIAYGSYFRGVIFKFLKENYEKVELNAELSLMDISEATGIHPNDVIELLDSFGYILLTNADEHGIYDMEWNVDWEHVEWYLEKRTKEDKTRVVFDDNCLSWEPRRITPTMDGFCDPSQEDFDAEKERQRQLQLTRNAEPMPKTSMPCGSVKKERKTGFRN